MDPGKHIRTWQVHTGTFLANSHSLQQSLGQRLPKKKHDMFLSNNRVQVQSNCTEILCIHENTTNNSKCIFSSKAFKYLSVSVKFILCLKITYFYNNNTLLYGSSNSISKINAFER